jgi:Cu(I)/Ag(I) efflux system membrane fusion protein
MKSIYKITLITLLSVSLIQCKPQKEQKKTETTETEEHDHSSHSHGDESKHEHKYMASSTEADTMKASGFNVLYFSYFKMRDALSLDNKTKAADYAGSMYRAINNINPDSFSKTTKQAWQVKISLIKESAMKIANSADNLKMQRSQISLLSLNLMELMKTSKPKSPVYLLHCIKSNDRKGGSWLSLENNIDRNPYQNNTPEPCGVLIETIE